MGISNWKVVELRACLRITLKGGDRHFRFILLNLYKLVAYWCFNGDLDWGGGGVRCRMSNLRNGHVVMSNLVVQTHFNGVI